MTLVNISRSRERLQQKIKGFVYPVPESRKQETGRELLEILSGPSEDTQFRRDIILLLGELKCVEAIPVLVDLAQDESVDGSIKRACVNALNSFDYKESMAAFFRLLGIHLATADKWVRQLAAHHLTTQIRRLKRDSPKEAEHYFSELCGKYLNSENSYTRMNTAIVLRLLGSRQAAPHLEQRLAKEKAILAAQPDLKGIPFVIREIEKALQSLTG